MAANAFREKKQEQGSGSGGGKVTERHVWSTQAAWCRHTGAALSSRARSGSDVLGSEMCQKASLLFSAISVKLRKNTAASRSGTVTPCGLIPKQLAVSGDIQIYIFLIVVWKWRHSFASIQSPCVSPSYFWCPPWSNRSQHPWFDFTGVLGSVPARSILALILARSLDWF